MAAITAENREGWQALANQTADQRPSVGKNVIVDFGKHKGKSGEVFWHGVDKYERNYYKSDAQLILQQMMGRSGYRVGVQTADGERFFVKGDNVTVLALTIEQRVEKEATQQWKEVQQTKDGYWFDLLNAMGCIQQQGS